MDGQDRNLFRQKLQIIKIISESKSVPLPSRASTSVKIVFLFLLKSILINPNGGMFQTFLVGGNN